VIYAKLKEFLAILLPFQLYEFLDVRNVGIERTGQDFLECIIVCDKWWV
jgi:hypothetical protein